MDGEAWERLVERLRLSRGRRSLLAGLAGASLIGSITGLPNVAIAKKKRKKRATICRKGQTLSVTKKKKQKHLLPGDTPGQCPQPGTTSTPGSTTSTTSTTSGPVCPDVKPTDNLQAAINHAEPGSTLRLCPGTFRVTSPLSVEKDLTLVGAGVEETILDGENTVAVLGVGESKFVTLEHLTITRGFAAGEGRGGGIANSGNLTLRHVTVSFCEADKGGGIALFRFSTLTMNANSVVKRNSSRSDGGGILNDGLVTMNEGSFVRENTAGGGGGGIMTLSGNLTMNGGSFVIENTAPGGGGGGIGGFGSWVTLNDGSTVQGNEPNDCNTESGACE